MPLTAARNMTGIENRFWSMAYFENNAHVTTGALYKRYSGMEELERRLRCFVLTDGATGNGGEAGRIPAGSAGAVFVCDSAIYREAPA